MRRKKWNFTFQESDLDKLPKNILTTGFFTVDWQKMSKSLWNVIDPVEYSEIYSKDVLTLYLLSGFNIWYDWDFDNKQALFIYNAKLANNFGNLENRVVVLSLKNLMKIRVSLEEFKISGNTFWFWYLILWMKSYI